MQVKRYDSLEESTVASGAASTMTIVNDEARKGNFHGIRTKGRIRADNVSADNEAHGKIILGCAPASVALNWGDFDSDSELEDARDWIIAVEPWSVFGGSTNPIGYGVFYDWDIAVNSSRTCGKDGYIFVIVGSDSGSAKSVIVANAQLSSFQTNV